MRKSLFIWAGLTLGGSALAHPMPNSVVLLDIHDGHVQMEVQLPAQDLGLATGEHYQGELTGEQQRKLTDYLLQHINLLTSDGEAWQEELTSMSFTQTANDVGTYGEVVAELEFTPSAGESVKQFTLDYDAVMHQVVTHTALVSIREDWENGVAPETEPVQIGVIQPQVKDGEIAPLMVDRSTGSNWQGFSSMFRLGMSHIAEGTDHLLFLLTLLLPAPLIATAGRWNGYAGKRESLRHIALIITAFTIGHSLSLVAASLLQIPLPTLAIELLVAFSILVSAVHAYKPIFPGRELWVAAGFGLIHGLAFSFTLSEMQLTAGQLLLSLLGFNLGIETMQLVVMVLSMPWLILLAQTSGYTAVRVLGAGAAALAATGWMLELMGIWTPLNLLTGALTQYGGWLIAAVALFSVAVYANQHARKTWTP